MTRDAAARASLAARRASVRLADAAGLSPWERRALWGDLDDPPVTASCLLTEAAAALGAEPIGQLVEHDDGLVRWSIRSHGSWAEVRAIRLGRVVEALAWPGEVASTIAHLRRRLRVRPGPRHLGPAMTLDDETARMLRQHQTNVLYGCVDDVLEAEIYRRLRPLRERLAEQRGEVYRETGAPSAENIAALRDRLAPLAKKP